MTPLSADLLAHQDWTFPVPIRYGPGRRRELADICKALGVSRPLLVTDRGTRQLPFISAIEADLRSRGLVSDVYAGFSPNPRDHEVMSGRAQFRDGGHDAIIAVGGGSGMDGGKALATVANNNVDLWAFEYEQTPPTLDPLQAFAPLITVPTTAGTGAETESTAMITETERRMKLCTWHPHLRPSCAVLDPELTCGLPANLTAWTGCDALIHAIEAYCVPGFHPLCDGAALEGLRLVARWLPTAVAEPENLEARAGMLAGSCLAGIAFLKGLGLVHAISHMVGAEYDTHHGLTNAITLPAVLRFNRPAIESNVAPIGHALGLEDPSFDNVYGTLCDLLDAFAIPRTLGELDIPASGVARLAEKAGRDSAATTNPRIANLAEMEQLIEDARSFGR
jgi:alcohol dehydrogenase class IV